jgi:uncharacterized protein involved in response to NO
VNGARIVLLALAAATAHLVRWIAWRRWKTLRTPIVWVLHLAYGCIPVYLSLRALAELLRVSASTATHVQTLGAAGTVQAVLCSVVWWSAGFSLFAVCYWRALTHARIDGKPG